MSRRSSVRIATACSGPCHCNELALLGTVARPPTVGNSPPPIWAFLSGEKLIFLPRSLHPLWSSRRASPATMIRHGWGLLDQGPGHRRGWGAGVHPRS
jgi:hypothetical protein